MKNELIVLPLVTLFALSVALIQIVHSRSSILPANNSKTSTSYNETALNQPFITAQGNPGENINGAFNTSLANNAIMSKGS